MKIILLAIFLGGVAAAQPTPIPTGQGGPAYQTAVNNQFLWMFNNSARPTATMTINGVTITLGAANTLTLADLTSVWGTGSRPVMANGLGTIGHCAAWAAEGLTDAGSCGGGNGSNDLEPTKVSGTVVTVDRGVFRYGTNVSRIAGTITYTLLQIPITSIVTGATTRLNTATNMFPDFQSGNAVAVNLVGSGPGCAAGTGVFVGIWNYADPNGIDIVADTSGGCSFTSGTLGAQTGGTAIIFGNIQGQIEMSHSAAMGAIVSVSGSNGVTSQTVTGDFPAGSVPIASSIVTAGAFDTVTDYRATLSNMLVQPGAGIDVTMVGGQAQVATASNIPKTDAPSVWLNSVVMKDATKTFPWRSGTGSPNARDNCIDKGEAYLQTDTLGLWLCSVPDTPGTWVSVFGGSSGGGSGNRMTYNSVVMTYNGVAMTYN